MLRKNTCLRKSPRSKCGDSCFARAQRRTEIIVKSKSEYQYSRSKNEYQYSRSKNEYQYSRSKSEYQYSRSKNEY